MSLTPLIICIGLFILWIGWTYNRLVAFRNRVREAWTGIEVQRQRRHHLIPNLVTAVESYASHESGLLDDLTRLRAQPRTSRHFEDAEEVENDVSESLGRLMAAAERSPDLKADTDFQALRDDLVEIEDHLQYARRYHNGAVRDQNTFVGSFPGNLAAWIFRFDSEEFFEVESALEPAPAVSPGDNP